MVSRQDVETNRQKVAKLGLTFPASLGREDRSNISSDMQRTTHAVRVFCSFHSKESEL
jgi:hypothetical protein